MIRWRRSRFLIWKSWYFYCFIGRAIFFVTVFCVCKLAYEHVGTKWRTLKVQWCICGISEISSCQVICICSILCASLYWLIGDIVVLMEWWLKISLPTIITLSLLSCVVWSSLRSWQLVKCSGGTRCFKSVLFESLGYHHPRHWSKWYRL